jgi:hypothetical protein
MSWLVVIVLAPLLFVFVAVYIVFQIAAFLLRLFFAPVLWLSRLGPPRQRIELRHYSE